MLIANEAREVFLNRTAPTLFIRDAYLKYKEMILFNNLHLTLTAGQFTCLLGLSGVGKSTLLRLIAGLIKPTDPFSRVHITSDQPCPLNTQIAYLGQNEKLIPWMNALDNALIGYHLRGKVSSHSRLTALNLFNQVGLKDHQHKYPKELSGGMQQRVILVRTLLENKPVVLLDEPFSALDAITRFELQNLTVQLLQNCTVLFITHDPLEAVRMADVIYILTGQPAFLKKVSEFSTKGPRNPDDPEVMHHHADLFHALMRERVPS